MKILCPANPRPADSERLGVGLESYVLTSPLRDSDTYSSLMTVYTPRKVHSPSLLTALPMLYSFCWTIHLLRATPIFTESSFALKTTVIFNFPERCAPFNSWTGSAQTQNLRSAVTLIISKASCTQSMHRILYTEAQFNNKNNLKEVLIFAYALQITLK